MVEQHIKLFVTCFKANRHTIRTQNNKQPDLINQEQMFVAIVKGYGDKSNIKNAQ